MKRIVLALSLFFLLISASRIDASIGYVDFATFPADSGLLIIDTDTNTLIDTVPHAYWDPKVLAITPDEKFVYVSWADTVTSDGYVSVFDVEHNVFIADIFLEAASFPKGLAITPDGSRVYITMLSGSIYVVDTVSNSVMDFFIAPGGAQCYGFTISPDGHTGYVGLTTNDVGVIDLDTNTFIFLIPVAGPFHYGLDVTPDGSLLYVSDNTLNQVYVIDTATNAVIATVPVGNGPWGLAVMPNGQFVYVANSLDDTVSVIDVATNTVVAVIPTSPVGPSYVAFTPDSLKALVTMQSSGTVDTIDTTTNTVISSILMPIGTISYSVDINQHVAGPSGLVDQSAQQASEQAQQLIYDMIEENFEDLLYSGLLETTEGTFPDLHQIYIIDAETLWTNEVLLTPFWCE